MSACNARGDQHEKRRHALTGVQQAKGRANAGGTHGQVCPSGAPVRLKAPTLMEATGSRAVRVGAARRPPFAPRAAVPRTCGGGRCRTGVPPVLPGRTPGRCAARTVAPAHLPRTAGRPPHPPAPHLQCAAGAGVRWGQVSPRRAAGSSRQDTGTVRGPNGVLGGRAPLRRLMCAADGRKQGASAASLRPAAGADVRHKRRAGAGRTRMRGLARVPANPDAPLRRDPPSGLWRRTTMGLLHRLVTDPLHRARTRG